MNHRCTSAVTACAATLLLVLTTGCDTIGGALGADPGATARPSPGTGEKPVTRDVIAESGAALAEAALTLNRLGAEHMVAEFTFTSETATGPWDSNLYGNVSFPTPATGDYPQDDMSGLYWIGPEGRSAHMPYFTEDRACLCTRFDDTHKWGITKERPVKAAAVLPAPPKDVEKVTVGTVFSLPFADVPIGTDAPELAEYGIESPRGSGAEAEVWPLVGAATSKDGAESVREQEDDTDVDLSADVLFDLDEHTLTPKADKVLDRAARRIEDSGAASVGVAGHTDDSGTDAVNEPLSERRADAVAKGLDRRIDSEVDFTTSGHGSKEPVADNATEEGAQRNRRVTVTLPRAAEGAASSPRPDSSAAPAASGKGRPMTEFAETVTDEEEPAYKAELKGLGLERIATDTVLLSYAMTSRYDSTEGLNPFWPEPSTTALSSLEGTSATDPATGTTYGSMVIDQGAAVPEGAFSTYCACTITSAGGMFVAKGETGTLYVLLPVPEDVGVLDIALGKDLTFKNARIED
ncbi:OmpA family protein [Murinocardiopsis flavida]|uniref:OmpA family protein n=1 Tax=Murinocardiopsis flavida TaxID=645275 RepID=A0A2P8DS02_9ACTN|nr:OmpA family protein [Murinocardiopsis flavida]PSK99964.1 OmpA family protein [Murinocardiopsis flavida]